MVAVEDLLEEERSPREGHTLCPHHLEESCMEIGLGVLILLWLLLVVLTVLASLSWLEKRLLRATERVVRDA